MNPFHRLAVEMRDNKGFCYYVHNGSKRISSAYEIKETAETDNFEQAFIRVVKEASK